MDFCFVRNAVFPILLCIFSSLTRAVTVLTIPEHTIIGQREINVQDFPIDIFYENPTQSDVAYVWSRVTCDVTIDIFRVDPCFQSSSGQCTENISLYHRDFPVDQVRTTENYISNFTIVTTAYYRAAIFNISDCLNESDCRFRFVVTAQEEDTRYCDMTIKLERGSILVYDQKRHYNESGYHNARSYNQLYSFIPTSSDDFPLYVRLDTEPSSQVYLEHAWGYSTTIYRSVRQGSFEVLIPLSSQYRQGDYFWVWITVLNSKPYDLQIGIADDPNANILFNVSPMVLLVSLIGLLLLSIFCYRAIPAPVVELEYPTTAPPPVTQEELEMFEITKWKGVSDDPEELNRCTICLDEFEFNEELRMLPCSHCFHKACVDHWLLRQQRRCPLCMQDVNEAVNYREQDLSTSYFTFVESSIVITE